MPSTFAGFPPEALQFFRSLRRNNRREWFQKRKDVYDEHVKAPMLALVDALNADFAKYAPEYVTEPKKAVFRIYRDTRFSKDKTPYKTNIAAVFRRKGLDTGGFYFSVSDQEVEVAGGIYHPSNETMLAVRTHIAEKHADLRRILARPAAKKLLGALQGDELTRPPKGFDAKHPALDLIRKKDWLLDVTLEPSLATTPQLYKEVTARFRVMRDFIEFLNAPLLARKTMTCPPEYRW